MATYRILYWQEVPTQIVAADGDGEVSVALPPKFLERVDDLAVERGLGQGDDYLAQWHWGDDQERDGSAAEVANLLVAELEAEAQW